MCPFLCVFFRPTMGRISEQTIEQIRSTANIVEVVSGYVELKKKGQNYFGLCPFHQEKTPSFSVNESRQIYKCFGCGAGGGSINFIMEIEQMEFVDALKQLAEQYSIEIDIDDQPGFTRDVTTQLMDIHSSVADFYYDHLKSETGKEANEHLMERGLSKETIQKFRLGFSPTGYDRVLKKLQNEKFSTESLKQCGLILETERGYIDRFRGRIMFSIANTNGKVIAFAGRIFQQDHPAKYVNSPETPIYHKSSILYGLWASKNEIRDAGEEIIVGGYLDYLQLYQAGIKNLVAVSGTSFTESHAKLLNRFCKTAYIAYDGDKAGMAAAIRAGYILMRNGLQAKVIEIPQDIDPDDWVKEKGPEPLLEAKTNALELLQFHFTRTGHDTSTPEGMNQFLHRVISEIVQITDPISRELQAQALSKISGVSEESIFQTLTSLIKKNAQYQQRESDRKTEVQITATPSLSRIEDELITICFSKNLDLRKLIFEQLNLEWLTQSSTKRLYDAVYIHLNSEKAPNPSIIMNELIEESDRRKLSALIFDLEKIDSTVNMAQDCLHRLEQQWIKKHMDSLREKLKHCSGKELEEKIIEIGEFQFRLKQTREKGKISNA